MGDCERKLGIELAEAVRWGAVTHRERREKKKFKKLEGVLIVMFH